VVDGCEGVGSVARGLGFAAFGFGFGVALGSGVGAGVGSGFPNTRPNNVFFGVGVGAGCAGFAMTRGFGAVCAKEGSEMEMKRITSSLRMAVIGNGAKSVFKRRLCRVS